MKCTNCGAEMEQVGDKLICPFCGYKTANPLSKENESMFEINGAVLNRYIGGNSDVVVPEGIIEISDFAFKDNNVIQSVHFPSSLIKIGKQSFFNCINLEHISGIEHVKFIGIEAFRGCNVKELTLSNNVMQLGKGCFSYMPNLKKLNLDVSKVIKFDDTFIRCQNLSEVNIENLYLFFPSFISYQLSQGNSKHLSTYYDAFMGTPFFHSLHSKYLTKIKSGFCPICNNQLQKGLFKRYCSKCNIDFNKIR